jgi:rubrerythrin
VTDFHEHLDGCKQCRDHPFELCKFGEALLIAAAKEDPFDLSKLGETLTKNDTPDLVIGLHKNKHVTCTGRATNDPCPLCEAGNKPKKQSFVLVKEREKQSGFVHIDYSAIEMRVMAMAAEAAKNRPEPEFLCAECGCETNTTMDAPCTACGSRRVALFSVLKPHLGPDWRETLKNAFKKD